MSLVCSHMLPSHTLSRRPLRTRPCQPSLAPSMPPTMLLPGRLPPAALATLTSSALGTSAALLPSNHLVIDAVLPGLASASSTVAYVANVTGRYDPNEGDGVVGVVVDRFAEDCKVHLGPACSFPGVLNLLAFEGATRRNRPRINVGDVVYAVVTDAGRYEECSLACVHEEQMLRCGNV